MIRSLRRAHCVIWASLALVVPVGFAWAIAGRSVAQTVDREQLPFAARIDRVASGASHVGTRLVGEQIGAAVGVLVASGEANERELYVVPNPASTAPDILLYTSVNEPHLGADLPSGAHFLGPMLLDGTAAAQRLPADIDAPWVLAFSLPEQRVVARFHLPVELRSRAQER